MDDYPDFPFLSGIPTPKEFGNKLIIGSQGLSNVVDPLYSTLENHPILDCLYDTLFSLSNSGAIQGSIAQSWSFEDDGRVLHISIREGVRFHNGMICDAYSIASSFNRPCRSSVDCSIQFDRYLIHPVSDHTLRVESLDNMPVLISDFASLPSAIVYIDAVGECICGTGPFQIYEISNDNIISLSRTNNHFSDTPRFQYIEFKSYDDSHKLLTAFETRQVQVARIDSDYLRQLVYDSTWIDLSSVPQRVYLGNYSVESMPAESQFACLAQAGLVGFSYAGSKNLLSPRRASYEVVELDHCLYPVNDNGATYGPFFGLESPDLIFVSNSAGVCGYIRAEEYDVLRLSHPSDAVRLVQQVSSKENIVTMYSHDGSTIVGEWSNGR